MPIRTTVRLLKHRRTKIVATVGPASGEPATIKRLIEGGVNVFRLNMSHGDHAGHRTYFDRIREAAADLGVPIAVLADLSGPKIRTGTFVGGAIELEKGSQVTLTTRDVPGGPGLIPSQYQALARDVRASDRILLADGTLELRVEGVENTEIACSVVQGGALSSHQGINLPGVNVSAPSLTDKDIRDARFALEMGVDFLALSYVRRASDIIALRQLVSAADSRAGIIAKIERPEALENAEEIIATADAIMVARGDLGVELPPEQVPVAQRQLIDLARTHNKPVIVATQMLESMLKNSRPTRAEIADVSLTVSNGADALMLSGETALGNYPLAAVEMMDRTARQTEGYLWHQGAFGAFVQDDAQMRLLPDERDEAVIAFGDAVANATALLSRQLLVRMILVMSESGMSAVRVSAARPAAPVIAASPNADVCRRMSLMWGVVPVQISTEDMAAPDRLACRLSRERELARPGNRVLVVRGFSSDPRKNTPSITVLSIEAPE